MSRFGSSTKQLFMCTPCVHRPNVTGKANAGKQFTWRRLRKWGNSGQSFVLSFSSHGHEIESLIGPEHAFLFSYYFLLIEEKHDSISLDLFPLHLA